LIFNNLEEVKKVILAEAEMVNSIEAEAEKLNGFLIVSICIDASRIDVAQTFGLSRKTKIEGNLRNTCSALIGRLRA